MSSYLNDTFIMYIDLDVIGASRDISAARAGIFTHLFRSL
jgi:hypothetical protein